jgi:hypothetical protein
MDDIEKLEREVTELESKSGLDFEREMNEIEAKRADLQRRKAEAEAIIQQQEASDDRKARSNRLKTVLSERAALLQRIDEAIDLLGELFRAEKVSRVDIWQMAKGARSDLREQIASDVLVLNTICARLGDYRLNPDRRFDKSQPSPKCEVLANIHQPLIQSMQG